MCYFVVKIHQFKTLPDYKEIKGTAAYLGKNILKKHKTENIKFVIYI